eukprot:1162020-Pelagomonas_calceolata.AAC.10
MNRQHTPLGRGSPLSQGSPDPAPILVNDGLKSCCRGIMLLISKCLDASFRRTLSKSAQNKCMLEMKDA